MNSSQLDRQLNAIQSKPGFHSTTGVSQFIRNAERLLAEEKFSSAMDQLIVAQQLDPDNQYIRAIMERIVALQSKKGTDAQHPLGVTIDKNSDPVPSDLQGVVKELTETAVRYQQDGQLESAFNALMKAYLMDPTSPHVASAEKNVLPAWELLRKRTAKMEPVSPRPAPAPQDSPTIQLDPVSIQRLQQLRELKDQERRDRERTLWREASNPPKPMDAEKPAQSPETGHDTGPADEHGIFSRLRKKGLIP
jgi:hypothetical protein